MLGGRYVVDFFALSGGSSWKVDGGVHRGSRTADRRRRAAELRERVHAPRQRVAPSVGLVVEVHGGSRICDIVISQPAGRERITKIVSQVRHGFLVDTGLAETFRVSARVFLESELQPEPVAIGPLSELSLMSEGSGRRRHRDDVEAELITSGGNQNDAIGQLSHCKAGDEYCFAARYGFAAANRFDQKAST